MPLDGLRAWIGEVERKLGIRTRLFLVLVTLALGGAGASIYLALDTQENAVSEGDVRALQDELEARFAGSATAEVESASQVPALEAELKALQTEVRELKDEAGSPSGKGQQGEGDSAGGTSVGPETGASGSAGTSKEALKDLMEKAKREQEK